MLSFTLNPAFGAQKVSKTLADELQKSACFIFSDKFCFGESIFHVYFE